MLAACGAHWGFEGVGNECCLAILNVAGSPEA
jgi:hypothetical protein